MGALPAGGGVHRERGASARRACMIVFLGVQAKLLRVFRTSYTISRVESEIFSAYLRFLGLLDVDCVQVSSWSHDDSQRVRCARQPPRLRRARRSLPGPPSRDQKEPHANRCFHPRRARLPRDGRPVTACAGSRTASAAGPGGARATAVYCWRVTRWLSPSCSVVRDPKRLQPVPDVRATDAERR